MNIEAVMPQSIRPSAGAVPGVQLDRAAAVETVKKDLAQVDMAELKRPAYRVELKDGKPLDPADEGMAWLGTELNGEAAPVQFIGPEPKYSTQFTGDSVSRAAWDLNKLMDEEGGEIKLMIGIGASEEQLAEHFGEIGRKIDAAFSAGQISREEYDALNKGLETYTENIASKAERRAALWEYGKEICRATRAMIEGGATRKEMEEHAKKTRETLQDKISAFVKEFCNIDRSFLAQLIGQVRSGGQLFPAGTVHSYCKENTRNYFKNDYVPFIPVEYP